MNDVNPLRIYCIIPDHNNSASNLSLLLIDPANYCTWSFLLGHKIHPR